MTLAGLVAAAPAQARPKLHDGVDGFDPVDDVPPLRRAQRERVVARWRLVRSAPRYAYWLAQ